MARRGDFSRQIVVSVVGVSGGEKEKGVTGVGKSCLCNRFIRPQADNYHIDHISVLSQTDFSGRVVNNDHFLYWGEANRLTEDGLDYNFQVVEQTEFIDDASFMPFKAGKMDSYTKRSCTSKIQSAEKLMYICKNQLGIEKEYEQKILPDGKLNVDGFLCIFDVSQVPNRSIEKMVEMTAAILMNCVKTKRPVVLVTTKNDEAYEIYLKEAEKLCCRKEFKGNIPMVESSSHENVNIDLAFLTLAQLVDKNRGKVRILSYFEAARQRKEVLDYGTDCYLRLIRSVIGDYRTPWSSASKKLVHHNEFNHFVELFGIDSAARMYRRHVKRLKEDFLQRKVESYMTILPSILRDFFPDLATLQDGDWLNIQQRISEHPEFDRYFVRCEDDIPWSENLDFLDSSDTRIPFDVLDSNEAETVFKNHVNALQAELEMRELPKRMRDRFKMLLEETGYVTPGKRLEEVRVLFMGRESFDTLSEHDRQIIYDHHQKDITEKARTNFIELLLEHAELFYHVKSIAPCGTITQDDIRDITEAIQEDSRYKALDRLDSERTLFLLQHLGFAHCPKKQHCPSYPSCTDCIIETLLSTKPISNNRPGSGTWSNKSMEFVSGTKRENKLNIVVLGMNGLAQELQNTIMTLCENDEYEDGGKIFSIEYRLIDGDVSLPENSFKTADFTPTGIICTYNNESTLEYIRESLEKSLVTQLEKEEITPHPFITILFAPDQDCDENTAHSLHDEGENFSKSLQFMFLDDGFNLGSVEGNERFDDLSISKALHAIVNFVQHNSQSSSIFSNPSTLHKDEPDIRIIMCMLCGDPYSIENVLSPLLNHQSAIVTGDRSIELNTFLDDCRRKVEVIVSSYHGAAAFREDLVHGFILVYSTKRKASLATLRAFSSNIPNLPIQILAITDTNSASAFFGSDVSQQLITEGNNIADRLQAHFMTSAATTQQKSAFYTPFFKEVWDKKPEIEQAFTMEDPSRLDDSGEGTLERPHQFRNYSSRGTNYHFMLRNLPARSHSAEGSSSEIYETVPTDGSLGDELDEPLSPCFHDDQQLTPSDDSDIYSHIDNDEEEHLVKPSLLKKHQHKFHPGWVDDSMTSRRVEEYWPDTNYGPHMFTTGRMGKLPPPPIRPKPKSSQTLKTFSDAVNHMTSKQPGKLNLRAYSNVTDAITKLSIKDGGVNPSTKLTKIGLSHAPLATPENMDLGPEYATVKDAVPGICYDGDYSYSRVPEISQAASAKARQRQRREKAYSDSDSEWSSLERRRSSESSYKSNRKAVQKRVKKKRIPIPVATPRVPPLPTFYPAEGAVFNPRFSDERMLLESHEKASQSSGSEASDGLPANAGYLQPQHRSSNMRHKVAREISYPAKLYLHSSGTTPHSSFPSAFKPIQSSFHNFSSHYQVQSSDTEFYPLCKLEGETLYHGLAEEESSIDISSPRDPHSPISISASSRKEEKSNRRKASEQEKRLKEEEKKRNKEEEKARKEKERDKKKAAKSGSKAPPKPALLDDFVQAPDKPVPLFVEKCVRFIEDEGVESEGIYRVPGNKVHVDQLTNKFKEEGEVDFVGMDIPVNAAATALKDYLKQLPPLLPQNKMEELTNIAGIGDRSCRLLKLKEMLTSLPRVNFEVLKFIFQHFVQVAENSKLNSMDSKNLAICWWPTLLHTLQFNDISEFESQRPHIEDIIQTLIDQFPFLFQGKEDYVMV